MAAAGFGLSTLARLAARSRMPLTALGIVTLAIGVLLPVPRWWPWLIFGTWVPGLVLYFRLGTPRATAVDIAAPVLGRWLVFNSPTSRVPSHFVHAWSQTYAIDLVADPEDGSRPDFSWWPLVRRPTAFPGFGQPIFAPVSGFVVLSRSFVCS